MTIINNDVLNGTDSMKLILDIQLQESDLLPDDIRMTIKAEIIDILVAIPDRIRPPLSDAVSLISESDFPEKWETLIQVINISRRQTSFVA